MTRAKRETDEEPRLVTIDGPYGPMKVQKDYDRWAKGRGFTWGEYERYRNCWMSAQLAERRRANRIVAKRKGK